MIWPFRKRTKRSPRVEPPPEGFADVHSHLLWGLDDGPADVDGSTAALEAYRELGYTIIAATPHHDHPMFEAPDPALVDGRCRELMRLAGADGPTLVPSGEIMFTDGFFDRIESGALPALGPSRTFLVEFPIRPGGVPMGLDQTVFRLRVRGIALVIAHCERYPDLAGSGDLVDRLRRSGAILQVNLPSLVGKYGRKNMDAAWGLLERGEADLLATDLHSADDAARVAEALEELDAWNRDTLIRLASTNPRALLLGSPWSVAADA